MISDALSQQLQDVAGRLGQWWLVNGWIDATLTCMSTGSPQGCILLLILFIMYTRRYYLINFSDDYEYDSDYDRVHWVFISHCDNKVLDLNVSKTKETITDCRLKSCSHQMSFHQTANPPLKCFIFLTYYYWLCCIPANFIPCRENFRSSAACCDSEFLFNCLVMSMFSHS